MHTFLLGLSLKGEDVSSILDQSLAITKKTVSSLGFEFKARKRVMSELRGGWFYLCPAGDNKKELITEFVNEQFVVLVFGEIFGANGVSAAELVFQTWITENIEAVRLLDGCFSAVIIDFGLRTAFVVSDLLGHRTLRFFPCRGSIWVSPHDIPIVATGLCPPEFNLLSASSIVFFDWSLGGRSLVKAIEVCSPNEYIKWEDGDTRRVYKPLIRPENRIHIHDKVGVDKQVDLMIENIIEGTRAFCRNEPVVHMDLTAGLDTRAVLAVALAAMDSSRLKSFTAGDKNSFEVRTARRLAATYHLSHGYDIPKERNCDSFMAHCRLRAFMLNGDTNGKRAADGMPSYDETPILSGSGAEIFRGYYYPSSVGKNGLMRLTLQDAIQLFEKKMSRIKRLPWVSDELPEKVRLLLVDVLNVCRDISPIGSDILDLFYVFERYGRWGSLVARSTWQPQRFSPFNSPVLLRLGFKLPAPIGYDLALHKRIIRKLLPGAYYLPINRKTFLPLMGSSIPKQFLAKWIGRTVYYGHRLRETLTHTKSVSTNEQIRSVIFRSLLREGLGDLLLKEESIAMSIFKRNGVRKMIDEHIAGTRNYLQVMGHLAIIESYRHLLKEASHMARQRTQ